MTRTLPLTLVFLSAMFVQAHAQQPVVSVTGEFKGSGMRSVTCPIEAPWQESDPDNPICPPSDDEQVQSQTDKPTTANGSKPAAAAPVGVEPARTEALNDLENLARTKGQLYQTAVQAMLAELLKRPDVVALQKEAQDLEARANDALVKAAGKDPKTCECVYNFQTRKVIEKPKESAPK